MATASTFPSYVSLLMVFSLLLVAFSTFTEAQKPPIVNGLSWTFMTTTVPNSNPLLKNRSKMFSKKISALLLACSVSISMIASFRDVMDRCCLRGSAAGPGEQSAIPNLSLRQETFKIINDIRARVHKECGRVVSCSDILALASRDSVVLSGGPDYEVPLGRRDGTAFATVDATLANLPSPFSNATVILNDLRIKGFNARETVALSGGGHTIGIAHCSSFTNRLYPTQDPTLDKTYANNLKKTCPTSNSSNTAVLDHRSPNVFDNKYFVDLMNRQGLLTSDQDLYTDKRTRGIVTSFAVNQSLFFQEFVNSVIRMSQLSVLTGKKGEIRANCSVRNSNNVEYLASVVEEAWSEIM